MKKNWMILPALVLAATLVLMGCDEDKGKLTVVFDLAENEAFQNLAEGTKDANLIDVIPIREASGAGAEMYTHANFEVVKVNNKNAIQTTVITNWAGFDLNIDDLKLRAGDKIEIKGTLTKAGTGETKVFLNLEHAGMKELDGWNPVIEEDEDFEKEFKLTSADISNIKSANPKAIRVRTNQAGAVFVVSHLKITGLR